MATFHRQTHWHASHSSRFQDRQQVPLIWEERGLKKNSWEQIKTTCNRYLPWSLLDRTKALKLAEVTLETSIRSTLEDLSEELLRIGLEAITRSNSRKASSQCSMIYNSLLRWARISLCVSMLVSMERLFCMISTRNSRAKTGWLPILFHRSTEWIKRYKTSIGRLNPSLMQNVTHEGNLSLISSSAKNKPSSQWARLTPGFKPLSSPWFEKKRSD